MSNPNDSEILLDSNPQNSAEQHDRVCIIGSGNWGSAIATLVGRNCARLPHVETQVSMWVYEETVQLEDGTERKLTEVINEQHENVKYLPGIRLPENVVAVPDLAEACDQATLLIFVLPHQFLPRLMPTIKANCHPSCRGVSLIKGLGTFRACVYMCMCMYGASLHWPRPWTAHSPCFLHEDRSEFSAYLVPLIWPS